LYPYLTIVKEKRVKNLQSYDLLKLKNFDYKLITAIILMIWYFHQEEKNSENVDKTYRTMHRNRGTSGGPILETWKRSMTGTFGIIKN
jgi:hypothetical protein